MRPRTLLSALLLPALAACASGGSSGTASAGLAMGVPQGGAATWEIADTTVISIDAMGQMMEIAGTSATTLSATFASNGMGGTRMTATVDAYDARMNNPMGAPEIASGSEIDGQFVVDFDTRGVADILEMPDLSGNAENMFSPETLAHTIFPRLPGTPPTPGMSWTDTISVTSDRAGTFTDAQQVMTWTVAGEEMHGGRSLLRIDYTGTMSMQQDGAQMGMSFTQTLQGGTEGWVLWDLAAGVMEEHHSTASLDGLMEADQVPMPLPLAVTIHQVIRRVDGM